MFEIQGAALIQTGRDADLFGLGALGIAHRELGGLDEYDLGARRLIVRGHLTIPTTTQLVVGAGDDEQIDILVENGGRLDVGELAEGEYVNAIARAVIFEPRSHDRASSSAYNAVGYRSGGRWSRPFLVVQDGAQMHWCAPIDCTGGIAFEAGALVKVLGGTWDARRCKIGQVDAPHQTLYSYTTQLDVDGFTVVGPGGGDGPAVSLIAQPAAFSGAVALGCAQFLTGSSSTPADTTVVVRDYGGNAGAGVDFNSYASNPGIVYRFVDGALGSELAVQTFRDSPVERVEIEQTVRWEAKTPAGERVGGGVVARDASGSLHRDEAGALGLPLSHIVDGQPVRFDKLANGSDLHDIIWRAYGYQPARLLNVVCRTLGGLDLSIPALVDERVSTHDPSALERVSSLSELYDILTHAKTGALVSVPDIYTELASAGGGECQIVEGWGVILDAQAAELLTVEADNKIRVRCVRLKPDDNFDSIRLVGAYLEYANGALASCRVFDASGDSAVALDGLVGDETITIHRTREQAERGEQGIEVDGGQFGYVAEPGEVWFFRIVSPTSTAIRAFELARGTDHRLSCGFANTGGFTEGAMRVLRASATRTDVTNAILLATADAP